MAPAVGSFILPKVVSLKIPECKVFHRSRALELTTPQNLDTT